MNRCIDTHKCIEDGFRKAFCSSEVGFPIDSMQVKLRNEQKIRSIRSWEINDKWSVTERSTAYLLLTLVVVHATNKHRLHWSWMFDFRCFSTYLSFSFEDQDIQQWSRIDLFHHHVAKLARVTSMLHHTFAVVWWAHPWTRSFDDDTTSAASLFVKMMMWRYG